MSLQGHLNTSMFAFSNSSKSHFDPRMRQNVTLLGFVTTRIIAFLT